MRHKLQPGSTLIGLTLELHFSERSAGAVKSKSEKSPSRGGQGF